VVQGTVLDFVSREPVDGVVLKYSSATSLSLLGTSAPVQFQVTSDADGRFKEEKAKPSSAPLGFVARASKTDYQLSITGVSAPPYGCGTQNHDMLIVEKAKITEWSEMLAEDAAMANDMPLGAKGGAIGRVIDIDTNEGIAGAHVVSQDGGSGARIRYLNDAEDGWVEDVTGSSGVYVVTNPGLGEKFDAFIDDTQINDTEATIGSKSGMVFVVDLRIEADEQGL
jgi:hypothetical protein